LVAFYNYVYSDKGLTFYSGKQQQIKSNQIHVSSSIIKEKALQLGGELYSSLNYRSELGAHIIAQFLTDNKESIYYSGLVNYYFKHFIKLL